MSNCAIVTCKNNRQTTKFITHGITFHRFPSNPATKNKWIAATARGPVWCPLKNSTICSEHFEEKLFRHLTKSRRLFDWAVPTLKLPDMEMPGTSGTGRPSSSLSDDDFSWPESRNETENEQKENEEEQSNASDQFIEHHEIDEDGMQDITEVKIEPPDELDLDAVKTEPEMLNTILGSDGGASGGFSPFVRATNINLPTINMFAVMEFISKNNYYTTLDYEKLKNTISPNNTKLLSGLRVQNCQFVHRVRCTVHLQTSSHCGIEYDTDTHTVTRSECMCARAPCDHVAALLMWLHCVSNQKRYNPKLVPDDSNTPTGSKAKAWDSKVESDQSGQSVRDDSEVSLNEPDDPLNVADGNQSRPSTAKRKKIAPPTPGSYTTQVYKTKSMPKETDTKIDESIIKCSFTRKCFFNVWRSTRGNFNEKLRHTRSIMTKAFHDANYVIDFLPLEKRLEELCMEIEGYWNVESNREGFETKFSEWFSAVENIDMKKTKREIVPGSSTGLLYS